MSYAYPVSKFAKLLQRLQNKPKDFSYDELVKLLNGLGYQELKLGKTSGSRVAFMNEDTRHIIRLHKPHPLKILKAYQIELILEELKNKGYLS